MLFIILMGAVGRLLWLIGIKKTTIDSPIGTWDMVCVIGMAMLVASIALCFMMTSMQLVLS